MGKGIRSQTQKRKLYLLESMIHDTEDDIKIHKRRIRKVKKALQQAGIKPKYTGRGNTRPAFSEAARIINNSEAAIDGLEERKKWARAQIIKFASK